MVIRCHWRGKSFNSMKYEVFPPFHLKVWWQWLMVAIFRSMRRSNHHLRYHSPLLPSQLIYSFSLHYFHSDVLDWVIFDPLHAILAPWTITLLIGVHGNTGLSVLRFWWVIKDKIWKKSWFWCFCPFSLRSWNVATNILCTKEVANTIMNWILWCLDEK